MNTSNFPGDPKMVQVHIKGRQNVLEHIKISRRAFSKFRKNACDFPGGKTIIRTDQIFPEDFPKFR